jgi:acyl dehydratase
VTPASPQNPISRTFTRKDQQAFAELSGDHNPIHTDPLAARRLMFGGPVVHGIHAVLWALEATITASRTSVKALDVEFLSPLRVGDSVHLSLTEKTSVNQRLELSTNAGERAVRIDVEWDSATNSRQGIPLSLPKDVCPPAAAPRPLLCSDAAGLSGSLDLCLPIKKTGSLFPNLIDILPRLQVSALLACTRLVGMECPGLHSLFSGLSLDLTKPSAERPTLDFRVTKTRPRLSLVDMAISGGGFEGRIRALFRPAPAMQKTFAELAALVDATAFRGERALVIGGSRGLGEVAAKLLAAGGADVVVTYQTGKADAERIVSDLAGTCQAAAVPFDVTAPTANPGTHLGPDWQPTLLCYFATPHIGKKSGSGFSESTYASLRRIYVDGFKNTLDALDLRDWRLLKVLYPSTVYVDTPADGLHEYAKAKADGERMCADLAADYGFSFYAPRLPRLATDQTAQLFGSDIEPPESVILTALHDLVVRRP